MDDLLTKPPQLWSSNPYFVCTRRGKILKKVNERYLRDDLGFGFLIRNDIGDGAVSIGGKYKDSIHKLDSTKSLLNQLILNSENGEYGDSNNKNTKLVICDANVLIHNLDVLEDSKAIPNICIPQTALQECRKNSFSSYNRCIQLLRESDKKKKCVIFFPNENHVDTQPPQQLSTDMKSDNDKNDLKLRCVSQYFATELQGTNIDVIFLTDDFQSKQLSKKEQKQQINDKLSHYKAISVRQYISSVVKQDPSLSYLADLVAQFSTSMSAVATTASSGGDTNTSTKYNQLLNSFNFTPHLSTSDLLLGIKQEKYYQGIVRAKRGSDSTDCYVTIRQGDERIAVTIKGHSDMNRAVDGDVVCIQLKAVELWEKDLPIKENNEIRDDDDDTTTKKKIISDSLSTAAATTTTKIASDTAEPSIKDEENIQDAFLLDSENVKPTGKVVGIIRRNFRQNYCGSIFNANTDSNDENKLKMAEACESEHSNNMLDGSCTCLFYAVDSRIPPILIRTTQKERLLGKRILTSIDSWPIDSPFPLGHYVKTLGDIGDKDVETEVLLHEHDIPCDGFSAKVLACLPPVDYEIKLENDGRKDLRHIPVLSIDPPGCKDIDDALHCIPLPNGNFQVGVHIADVTHYVKPNSELDKEAANRSTSTYLVNKRLDMLPSLLTTDLCSLKGNVDRFAFSVIWEITPEGNILNVDFHKSIIHSIAALTYQQAQAFIEQPNTTEKDIQANSVKRLAVMARIFRKRRLDAGALTLASPEVKFTLDSESLNPTDCQAYALLEANALVEEFMLLANVTVGKKILRHYPTLSVLRRHPSPNRSMFTSLITKAKCKGFQIDIEDSKALADSLDQAVLPEDPYFNKLLRILSTRCMSPAQYFCSGEYTPSDWHHYGLAAPVYTHFTSPIRRYADVLVHRLLAAAIGVDPLPKNMSSKGEMHDLAFHMNRRHRAAQNAGRASVNLHTHIFFGSSNSDSENNSSNNSKKNICDGYVLDVDTSNVSETPSFLVFIPKYGIEGRVKLSQVKMSDEKLKCDRDQHKIIYDNDACIQVFDKVKVKVDIQKRTELVIQLLEPKFGNVDSKIEAEENIGEGDVVLSTPPYEGKKKNKINTNRKSSSKKTKKRDSSNSSYDGSGRKKNKTMRKTPRGC